MNKPINEIFIPNKDTVELIENAGIKTPLFLTDGARLQDRVQLFKKAFSAQTKIFYALKANYNPSIVKLLLEAGVDGIDAVSPFEVDLALQLGLKPAQITFTGNNSTSKELEEVHNKKVLLNIGSLSELARYGELAPKSELAIRLNPGVGSGEFKGTITGGANSKFGISPSYLQEALALIKKYRLKLLGIHCHIGSGFYESSTFKQAISAILAAAKDLDNLEFVDFGGGFGVRYKPGEQAINLAEFAQAISEPIAEFNKQNGRDIEVRIEPGKSLVAEATALIVQVSNIKQEGENLFVGTNSGFNHLIRPAFYGAYHHIVNIRGTGEEARSGIQVVGNICESSDIFNSAVRMPVPELNDYLAILTAGAYCASMSSLYNLRPYAAEALLLNEQVQLTRRPRNFTQTMSNLGFVDFA